VRAVTVSLSSVQVCTVLIDLRSSVDSVRFTSIFLARHIMYHIVRTQVGTFLQ